MFTFAITIPENMHTERIMQEGTVFTARFFKGCGAVHCYMRCYDGELSIHAVNNGGKVVDIFKDNGKLEEKEISAEINVNQKTVHFFFDGKQQPFRFIGIPANVRVGFTGYNHRVRSVQLQSLSAPTADPRLICRELGWDEEL